MLTALWAAKGGAGTSTLAAAHALVVSTRTPCVLVDLAGDLPAVLGTDLGGGDRPPDGVAEWSRAGRDVPGDALERLQVHVADGLALLPRGRGPIASARGDVLAGLLAASPRHVVVDAGTDPSGAAAAVVRGADRSILVTRACYLALRRAAGASVAPTEVALVAEAQRALGADDVAAALRCPVRTTVPVDPGVARAVDAGLLAARLPRALRRAVDAPAAA